ncbi:MAG TPA: carbon starvation CstA 5TM domain-containing protein, partial [Thermodesulfovibrionales bacterium]|nr:carbon starvation CstA 5TM domain-containing protein [Thermodesulfovibrionales bacterium]
FAINTKLTFEQIGALGFSVDKVRELSSIVGTNIEGRPGGAVSLAVGMASILSSIPGMKGLMSYWYNFALMFEALFILTTVDTGTRVARFLLQELGSHVYKPLSRQRWIPGIVITSLLVVAAWAYLIYSGNISSIWPMFGVANQLLAAMALGVGTTLIIKAKKIRYAWTTFIPMTFMFTTTFTASWELIVIFREKASRAASLAESVHYRVDAFLVLLMLVLASIILVDILHKWYGYLGGKKEMTTSEVVERACVKQSD